MNDFTKYDGQLLFAQPANRSLPVRALLCVGASVNDNGLLSVVETGGGILSGQVFVINIGDAGWKVLAHGAGDDTIGAIIDSMSSMLTNNALTVDLEARTEARETREVLIKTLQRNRDRLRIVERAAEDALLASNREVEDQVAKEVFTALLDNPNPQAEQPQQPFSQGSYDEAEQATISIGVNHDDPAVRQRLTDQVVEKLKKE